MIRACIEKQSLHYYIQEAEAQNKVFFQLKARELIEREKEDKVARAQADLLFQKLRTTREEILAKYPEVQITEEMEEENIRANKNKDRELRKKIHEDNLKKKFEFSKNALDSGAIALPAKTQGDQCEQADHHANPDAENSLVFEGEIHENERPCEKPIEDFEINIPLSNLAPLGAEKPTEKKAAETEFMNECVKSPVKENQVQEHYLPQ